MGGWEIYLDLGANVEEGKVTRNKVVSDTGSLVLERRKKLLAFVA